MAVDRRSFVKGAVAGAAAGAAAASGVALWRWSVGAPSGALPTQYAGAKVLVGSPTNRGVPIVPIAVDGAGYVHVRVADLRPFEYCGRRADSETEVEAADVYARYYVPPYKIEQAGDAAAERFWYLDRLGERVRAEDFRDRAAYDGASFVWRDEAAAHPFVGVLIKMPRQEIAADGAAAAVLDAAIDPAHDLVAYDTACTHLCCIAGWHEDPSAERLGLWDTIFCTCHNARFDPREVVMYEFGPAPY